MMDDVSLKDRAIMPLSVAPMMDWTDRHDRYFLRLIAPHAVLYTEMVTTGALLHGDHRRHLAFSEEEHPVVLQLGGSEPDDLATCAVLAERWGYDEVNLNCGCPSERVQKGAFGACLMAEPDLVARCVKAMNQRVRIPVTVKCRIGIDDHEPKEMLPRFLETMVNAGCNHVIIHARKAWLKGLSPKQNRDIPPLDYDLVYAMKDAFPELAISINGGITQPDDVPGHLAQVDGVMIGREAYKNPWSLRRFEKACGNDIEPGLPDRKAVLKSYADYCTRQMEAGVPLHAMTRHILGLFNGMSGARLYRRTLSEDVRITSDVHGLFERAISECHDETLTLTPV